MKKCAIVVLAAFMASAALPVFADVAQEQETCAIAANNCLNKAEILQKRIKKLRAEVKKNEGKYSKEDMKALEQKLQDAIDQLDKIEGKK
ncbi:MAG TPA: hypothetical protein VMJ66_10645 [Geobacteraceae bacterium]|nr:hypothetical protein [Geobacteraceae bacterium]